MLDLEKFTDGLHEYIARAIKPLNIKIKELESRPLEKGDKGDPGKDGEPGKDGSSVCLDDLLPAMEYAMAKWQLEFERRAQDILQKAIERMPKPTDGKDGKDGKDGLGFDDLTIDDDGDGTVVLRYAREDVVKEHTMRLPRFLDKGVYSDGVIYKKGDGVSFGGSFWMAQKDSPQGRPGQSDDWRLAVKKGRDGKDGERGKDYVPHPVRLP